METELLLDHAEQRIREVLAILQDPSIRDDDARVRTLELLEEWV